MAYFPSTSFFKDTFRKDDNFFPKKILFHRQNLFNFSKFKNFQIFFLQKFTIRVEKTFSRNKIIR